MTVKVSITADPKGERALKQLLELDGRAARAGLFTPEMAMRGAGNEFGTGRIPSRPWASTAADNGAPALAALAEREIGALADGRGSAGDVLEEFGETMADSLRSIILDGEVPGPPLAASTIARKGHDRKLIDTGEMVGSITHTIGAAEEADDDA